MDTPSNNVVPFKVVADNTVAAPEGMSPHQQDVYDSVLRFAQFLVDNAASIDYFVAMVAAREEQGMQMTHVVTPPISASDFAFGIKKLEHTFFTNLSDMGVPG